ncbi:MAG: TOBE domain-containing protein [Actinomycetota bacterium]
MTWFRVAEAARLLGVSDDTLRRWVDRGRLPARRDDAGRLVIGGADLAALAQARSGGAGQPPGRGTGRPAGRPAERDVPREVVVGASARNRLRGIVTRVVRDGVMAQVELQAGPYRLVSLMSREAADELGLQPGVVAVAAVKATNVVVEIPGRAPA